MLGLDPGLRRTGWGVIEAAGSRLRYIASGTVATDDAAPLADRLKALHHGLVSVIDSMAPDSAAVEETFVNANPRSTLKLGMARGVVLLVPALTGLPVAEYHNRAVKMAVVGSGRAAKAQVGMMVRTLLPACRPDSEDAADALAVAICHAHTVTTDRRWRAGLAAGAAP